MEEDPKISFIIVNYQSEDFLKDCIASIKKNAVSFNYEIFIANNDNKLLNFSELKVTQLGKNSGFGSGCNAGAKIAQGEILCFLNPDTEILDDVKKIVDYFDSNDSVGIIGPKLVTPENKVQHWCAGCDPGFLDLVKNNFGLCESKKIWNSDKMIEADWVSGACLFVRKELFEKLKGFDEKFFMYFEDVDLCKRAINFGYKVIYYPEFSVKHFGGKSFKSKIKQKRYYYKSMFYYFKKHFGK